MTERIEQLKIEIKNFQEAMQLKNQLIQQTQNEIQQLIQNILSNQGGIAELEKLVEKEKEKPKCKK